MRVQFAKQHRFADVMTKLESQLQLAEFVCANKHRDIEFRVAIELVIDGYGDFAIATTEREKPWFLIQRCYVLAIALFLELPLKWYIQYRCPKAQYVYKKVFSCFRPPTPTSADTPVFALKFSPQTCPIGMPPAGDPATMAVPDLTNSTAHGTVSTSAAPQFWPAAPEELIMKLDERDLYQFRTS